MIHSKLINGILLIIGTSIGGGMLALPLSSADLGLTHSLIFLSGSWLMMTLGALLILEVNLRFPKQSNIISMAKTTLGLPGEIIAWIAYLFLLYNLLSAYISAGGALLSSFLGPYHLKPEPWLACVLFTLFFSVFVYRGIQTVISLNRYLIFIKLSIYLLLVILIAPYFQASALQGPSHHFSSASLMIFVTSFGFATIIPSLRLYCQSDLHLLRKIVWMGSIIPLVFYTLWIALIMGVIPREGENGLIAISHHSNAMIDLIQGIHQKLASPFISLFFEAFNSVCLMTAFLGVSLGLFDFLADGFKLHHRRLGRELTYFLTFAPPLILVISSPELYLSALSHAGIACVILLLILPTAMAWRSRLSPNETSFFLLKNKTQLMIFFMIALIFLIIALTESLD